MNLNIVLGKSNQSLILGKTLPLWRATLDSNLSIMIKFIQPSYLVLTNTGAFLTVHLSKAIELIQQINVKFHIISHERKTFRQKKLASHSHCFREDQAAIAAFFSACFLFLAGSPVNMIPANSTVPVKTGKCPNPDLNVKYWGNGAPTLCAISCKRFLYTPVSS